MVSERRTESTGGRLFDAYDTDAFSGVFGWLCDAINDSNLVMAFQSRSFAHRFLTSFEALDIMSALVLLRCPFIAAMRDMIPHYQTGSCYGPCGPQTLEGVRSMDEGRPPLHTAPDDLAEHLTIAILAQLS